MASRVLYSNKYSNNHSLAGLTGEQKTRTTASATTTTTSLSTAARASNIVVYGLLSKDLHNPDIPLIQTTTATETVNEDDIDNDGNIFYILDEIILPLNILKIIGFAHMTMLEKRSPSLIQRCKKNMEATCLKISPSQLLKNVKSSVTPEPHNILHFLFQKRIP
ncbi:hypothetical protein GQR58_019263 [Nymphon striatum]|nr:hypothetical protein GQR58_019263 [Nymphon striatum]